MFSIDSFWLRPGNSFAVRVLTHRCFFSYDYGHGPVVTMVSTIKFGRVCYYLCNVVAHRARKVQNVNMLAAGEGRLHTLDDNHAECDR